MVAIENTKILMQLFIFSAVTLLASGCGDIDLGPKNANIFRQETEDESRHQIVQMTGTLSSIEQNFAVHLETISNPVVAAHRIGANLNDRFSSSDAAVEFDTSLTTSIQTFSTSFTIAEVLWNASISLELHHYDIRVEKFDCEWGSKFAGGSDGVVESIYRGSIDADYDLMMTDNTGRSMRVIGTIKKTFGAASCD